MSTMRAIRNHPSDGVQATDQPIQRKELGILISCIGMTSGGRWLEYLINKKNLILTIFVFNKPTCFK